VADRDIDEKMRRTRRRPVPTLRIPVANAIVFGVVLGVAGFATLWASSNLLAALLATSGLLFYVFVYTLYLKRRSVQNIVIGGAAGAVPPLVGWAAVTGSLALPAWLMFAVVFYWTPPHFWALALKYRDDYATAGVPMLPVVVGVERTLDHIPGYTVVLVGVSLMLATTDALGALYTLAALVLGIGLVGAAWRLRSRPDESMRFFTWSNIYLAVLFVSMMADALIN
jgi:protoheme IX farnesyltransferase